MTWGTLEATPRIISQPDKSSPPHGSYRISEPSSREQIAHKLSSKASKSLRVKAELLGVSTPGIMRATPRRAPMLPPSWTPRKLDAQGNLTPAARRLLDRTTMSTGASRRADVMERMAGWSKGGKQEEAMALRWTPTPDAVSRRR
jgi:protein DGCR14